jgi:hypothetical protein
VNSSTFARHVETSIDMLRKADKSACPNVQSKSLDCQTFYCVYTGQLLALRCNFFI